MYSPDSAPITNPDCWHSLRYRQVPATPDEALKTSLMGIFEKRRFRNFLQYLAAYDEDKPDTFKGLLLLLLLLFYGVADGDNAVLVSASYCWVPLLMSMLSSMLLVTIVSRVQLAFFSFVMTV